MARTGFKSALHFVKHVVDGDTLRLRSGRKVRLLGVDTPETKHPRKPVEYYGPEAYRFTKCEAEKRFVTMDYDRHPMDRYGRTLAYVFRSPDEFFLNAQIIRQGYGYAYTRFPFRHMELFVDLQAKAKSEGLGLWAKQEGMPLADTTPRAGHIAPDAQKGGKEFWGSVNSNSFHLPGCVYARKIKPEKRVVFHSLEAALKAGYVPCRVCKPKTGKSPE